MPMMPNNSMGMMTAMGRQSNSMMMVDMMMLPVMAERNEQVFFIQKMDSSTGAQTIQVRAFNDGVTMIKIDIVQLQTTDRDANGRCNNEFIEFRTLNNLIVSNFDFWGSS